MTAEQKKMIRDNAQATIDLAEARLRDDRVTDENVRHDLEQIATLARALLAMVGEPSSPWSTKVCSCGRLTAEAPNPHARDACSLVHTVPLSREPSPYVLGADGTPVCSECSAKACEFLRRQGPTGLTLTQRCFDHRLEVDEDE